MDTKVFRKMFGHILIGDSTMTISVGALCDEIEALKGEISGTRIVTHDELKAHTLIEEGVYRNLAKSLDKLTGNFDRLTIRMVKAQSALNGRAKADAEAKKVVKQLRAAIKETKELEERVHNHAKLASDHLARLGNQVDRVATEAYDVMNVHTKRLNAMDAAIAALQPRKRTARKKAKGS